MEREGETKRVCERRGHTHTHTDYVGERGMGERQRERGSGEK